ncbi:hypothetical protein [Calycomorphotria hydatis]|uniref:Carboxypeptidase regulatory-like domain-containing protein n=1 Tax=Calycomorphotria hydatis TaxID=2528027 RepID=A0A517T4Q8_9PLAN|nr:hypothetical protein [Calycomorphotria hydatis]QDT63348.1 hypothetical protein V22_05690 [Calycomorphotria hydatis]
MRAILILMLCTGLCFMLMSGCGNSGDGPQIVPVSGQVTINGKPAAHVLVRFKPELTSDSIDSGPASAAFADEEGRYKLQVTVGERAMGAVVGQHRVSILGRESKDAVREWTPENPEDVIGEPRPPLTLPEVRLTKQQRKQQLTFTVPEDGTNSADFDL